VIQHGLRLLCCSYVVYVLRLGQGAKHAPPQTLVSAAALGLHKEVLAKVITNYQMVRID